LSQTTTVDTGVKIKINQQEHPTKGIFGGNATFQEGN
jgi:hypothetical protein